MEYRNTLLFFLLITLASSCTIEKKLNYKAQVNGDIVYKDSLQQIRYYNDWIDVGNELHYSLDITPARNCSLLLRSVSCRAILMDKKKNRVKELVFQQLVGKQYRTYAGGYILNPDIHYISRSSNSFICQDTLADNNITNRYEFTLRDKRYLTEKFIVCTILYDWMNLADGNVFTTQQTIRFKRIRFLMLDLIHR